MSAAVDFINHRHNHFIGCVVMRGIGRWAGAGNSISELEFGVQRRWRLLTTLIIEVRPLQRYHLSLVLATVTVL